MKLKVLKTICLSTCLLPPLILPVSGQSDEDIFELNPFSVTDDDQGYMATSTISGTAMRTSLMNVPMSINVITSEFLEDSLIGDFNEALDFNSSITQTGRMHGGPRPELFSIRGFRNRNTLVDGVTGGVYIPTQLIDRIEVVKGPNTLYGQSDPGGLINIITKTPLAEDGGNLTVKAGNHGWIQGSADVTVHAADGKLGLRFLADYKESDGFYWVDGSLSKFFGLSGNYQLGENSEFLFLLSGNDVGGAPVQRSTFGFEERATDLNGDGDTSDTVRQIVEARARYNNSFVPREYTTMTHDNSYALDQYYLSLGYRLKISDNHNLQYKYNFYDTETAVGFRAFNTFRASDGRSDANYSADLNTARDEVHTLNDIIGFETGNVRHQLLLGIRKSESINGGDGTYRLRAINGAEAGILNNLEAKTGKSFRRFLYKQDVLDQVPIWEERAPTISELRQFGVRVGTADRSFQNIDTYYATDNLYFMEDRLNILAGVRHVQIEQYTLALGGARQGLAVDESDTSFQIGGVYRINPNLSAFVNLADAFEPNTAVNPDTGDFYAPETSDAIEVGLKFSDLFDGRVGGSATVFEIKKDNVVRSDFNPVTFMADTAITSDESKGFEVELFTSPVENWDIVLGYTYLDAVVVGAISPELEGLRIEGAAPQRLTLFNSYSIKNGSLAGFRFGGGVVWAKGPIQQFGTPDSALIVEDGYTTLDLFARYTTNIGNHNVTLGLNVDNVTDEFFVRGRGVVNSPRQFLFSVSTEL